FTDVAASGLTKKELLGLEREKDKLSKTLGGIRDMGKTPQAVWVVDTKKEHLAVDEARKLNIPIVGILDTNCDPDEVDYAVPGNDDAIRSVALLTRIIADAVAEGLIERSQGKTGEDSEAEPMPDWERELLGAEDEAKPAEKQDEAEAVDAPVAEESAPIVEAAAPEAAAAQELAEEPAKADDAEPETKTK
ncbi:30S ribosomal protein S2, partial [uncultured Tessaracoccus sp.]|uniref:30S ribosomal protein S2 n=1 Tax=uncultured Tessaracoccus sp. TaxID=905023 RepID=UPI00262F17BC